MKKTIPVFIAFTMILLLCACGKASDEESTQIANPWIECESIEKAEVTAGFQFSYGDEVLDGEYTSTSYSAVENEMIDVDYTAGENKITIRQAEGENQDISGDYNSYEVIEDISDCGINFTINGDEGQIYLTTFSYNGYTYAVYSYDGASREDIYELITELTGVDSETYGKSEEQFDDSEETEGAPIVEEGRSIDEAKIQESDIAGLYSGTTYGTCSISIYSDAEENAAEVGNIEITDKDNNIVYSGALNEVMNNMYELAGQDVNITVYTDNGKVCCDLYINGVHADYFVMTQQYIS